jgi:predicted HD superfamily hydrolase involved in NAD metabolism
MSARASTDPPDAAPHARRAAARLSAGGSLAERITGERWQHTLGVAETAYQLAGGQGWPPAERDRALVAGLLHDVAKGLPRAAQQKLVDLHSEDPTRPTPDLEARSDPLLHARAGAVVAEREYGITDADVLEAIAFHPTGSPGPSPLVQLLFVADYLEPGRRHLDADDRELLARGLRGDVSLNAIYCRVAEKKIARVRELGLTVHPRTVAAWRAHCAEHG